MFPLDQHTIFLTLAGSQAHGTAREGSDVDLRGVCIAPLSLRLSLFRSFEQYEGSLPETLADASFRASTRIRPLREHSASRPSA
jgi:predicted nucleotidyltransferase